MEKMERAVEEDDGLIKGVWRVSGEMERAIEEDEAKWFIKEAGRKMEVAMADYGLENSGSTMINK